MRIDSPESPDLAIIEPQQRRAADSPRPRFRCCARLQDFLIALMRRETVPTSHVIARLDRVVQYAAAVEVERFSTRECRWRRGQIDRALEYWVARTGRATTILVDVC
jgi:hypothetical protein